MCDVRIHTAREPGYNVISRFPLVLCETNPSKGKKYTAWRESKVNKMSSLCQDKYSTSIAKQCNNTAYSTHSIIYSSLYMLKKTVHNWESGSQHTV